MTGPLLERFWAKVDKDGPISPHVGTPCWLWTGASGAGRQGAVYGLFRNGAKLVYAHRFSYELHSGPITPGVMIDHWCRISLCVNPSHLREATNKQNQENRQGAQSTSTSGVRGVRWHAGRQRWVGEVTHNGKRYHVGYFKTIELAEAAVIAKRRELFTHV